METRKSAKVHTLQTALERARNYCAYQERSQQEVRDKLYTLGLHQQEVEQGVTVLIEEGFISEERFAMAFAGGKFRIKRWGRIKIRAALKAKKISDYCIKKALAQFKDGEYAEALEKTMQAGFKKYKGKMRSQSAARYAISHGFEPELVWDYIRENAAGE